MGPVPIKLWRGFLNLLFPLHCAACGESLGPDNQTFLCSACFGQIKVVRKPVCEKCGKPGYIDICSECRATPRYYNMARAASIYEGVLRECIHKLKYGHQLYLAKTLSHLMAETLDEFPFLSSCDLIVPVPLHRLKERERGFNQAYLLGKRIGSVLKISLSSRNLRRVRETTPQTDLPRSLRLANVRDIFSVKDPLEFKGKEVLLVDDVFTTGSTVDECSRVLIEAGASKVCILTAARGE